ncbi:nodulation protein [Nitrospira sp. KM1]|uniref:carbamoyltransferase family protein n=1 Tax=Nitrospira sp. KM1 TaxID=1936990 RepID=UPI0013A7B378|nr:carbamoyltransferase [Nitrospira sp. KM1]BCA54229.1 nodulation protein [Nitrospira sp. KM1]
MIVLGISAFYHDSAAAIVRDGQILAAAQEERFTRVKHDAIFPSHAIAYCLREAGVTLDEVAYVGFYDKPVLTFDRLLETYFSFAPSGFRSFARALPVWVKEKLLQKNLIHKELNGLGFGSCREDQILFGFHHHSHAASAFYPSPFDRAAVLVMDGVGEWATTTIGRGAGAELDLLKEIRFPHSLGLLYAAFTYYLGFKVNEGEYKVMGLAPYGEPKFVRQIYDHLIDVKPDGSFRLDMQYFDYCTGLKMTNPRFADLFGAPARSSRAPLTQRDMDLARSIQVVTEETVLKICRTIRRETGERNLCLAGGVALNCVANGKIHQAGLFDKLWIQPASGDAGSAIGVALAITYKQGNVPRTPDPSRDAMGGSYLGPEFDEERITRCLEGYGAVYRRLMDDELYETVVSALVQERVVGWFQGRMEFGPRALGNRSILGDPRSPNMQRILNMKIKYRESFRPFAPAVLREDVNQYFDLNDDSPYMLLVAGVQKGRCRELTQEEQALAGIEKLKVSRSDIPAVTHVDLSARVQTVDARTNARFARLLGAFRARTGCGVLINTSFNIRDEPIVCSPEDAYRCFMGTEMDMLVVGNYVLMKSEQ